MKKKSGFTLVEIMIVVAIIGLLAAIAVPSFIRARESSQANACINNLRIVDAAVDQAAIEQGKSTGDTVDNLTTYIKGNAMPSCPVGPTVIAEPTVGTSPVCPNGIAGHVLANAQSS